MTTIHGNPDLYVSSTNKEPNWADHEQMSRYNGFYPDILEFDKTDDYNLTKTFYVGVYADQMYSTFSLSYFTENEEGQVGYLKLLVGKKQRGLIHPNWNIFMHPDTPVLDQPSLTYHFQVSSTLLKNKEV